MPQDNTLGGLLQHQENPRYLPSLYLPSGHPSPQAIRFYRMAHNMTQQEFADHIGRHVGTIRDWEQGRAIPSPASLVLLDTVVKYTRNKMEQHDGFLPEQAKLKNMGKLPMKQRDSSLIEVYAMADSEVRRLREENRDLREEIRELEDRLAQMRDRLTSANTTAAAWQRAAEKYKLQLTSRKEMKAEVEQFIREMLSEEVAT